MKCDLNIGFKWDEESQSLIDWEKRIPCPNEAIIVYTYVIPTFYGAKTLLCETHAKAFKEWCLGALEQIK